MHVYTHPFLSMCPKCTAQSSNQHNIFTILFCELPETSTGFFFVGRGGEVTGVNFNFLVECFYIHSHVYFQAICAHKELSYFALMHILTCTDNPYMQVQAQIFCCSLST
jgi:hypothetical protein